MTCLPGRIDRHDDRLLLSTATKIKVISTIACPAVHQLARNIQAVLCVSALACFLYHGILHRLLTNLCWCRAQRQAKAPDTREIAPVAVISQRVHYAHPYAEPRY